MSMQGILFDLYGTLFIYGDMRAAWKDWIEDLALQLAQIGVFKTHQELSEICDGFFGTPLQVLPGFTLYETRLHNLAERLGIKVNLPWCKVTAKVTMTRWQTWITLDPEAPRVLQTLRQKGVKIALLSNFDHTPHVMNILEQAQIREFFDAIIVSDAVGLKKPDPAIFQLAVKKLALQSEQCYFVGDHPEQDYLGAQNAGLKAILIDRNKKGVDRLQMNFYTDQNPILDSGANILAPNQISKLSDLLNFLEN